MLYLKTGCIIPTMYFLKIERETNTFYIRIFYVLLCKTFFATIIELKESDKLYEIFYTCFVNTLRACLHMYSFMFMSDRKSEHSREIRVNLSYFYNFLLLFSAVNIWVSNTEPDILVN